MPSAKPTISIDYDTITVLLSELVEHYQKTTEAGRAGEHWQSANGRSQVLIYGNSISLSCALDQRTNSILREFVLLYDNRHVWSLREYRWPHLCDKDQMSLKDKRVDLPCECLDDLMSYSGGADARWRKRLCHQLESEFAA